MLRLSSWVLVLAALASACVDTAAIDETETGDSAIVGDVLANTADVRPDRLVFPKAVIDASLRRKIDTYRDALAKGTTRDRIENVILLGDREQHATDETGKVRENAKNPYGFIRRALSYRDEGDRTTIMTEAASLDDAFKDLSEGRIVQVGSAPKAGAVTPQGGLHGTLKKRIPVIDVANRTIFANDKVSVKVKHGSVSLDTSVDLAAEISFFRLTDAHAIIGAKLDSELVVETSGEGPFDEKPHLEVFEGHWPIGSLGPIPVTLGLKTTIGCDVSGSGHVEASAGFRIETSFKAGIEYRRGKGVSGVGEASIDPSAPAPTLDVEGRGNAKCYLRPQLSLLFFDAVGPTVTPAIYGKLEATSPPLRASVTGGVSVDVGGRLTILGKDLGSIDEEVASLERPLWRNY